MDGLTGRQRRELIGSFYKAHWSKGKSFTYKHFQQMGISKTTLYRVMEKLDKGESLTREAGSGRKAKKMTPEDISKLKRYMKESIGASQRKAARKFGVSLSYINKILSTKTKLRYRHRKRVPAATEDQKIKQKTRCGKLRRSVMKPTGKTQIIMDDESYFPMKSHSQPGNAGFYTDDASGAGDGVRFATVAKFTPKVMVWVAFSEHGLSKPFIMESGAMNAYIYRTQCLPRLKEFVDANYRGKKVIFWPDLAPAHYQKDVIATLDEMKIPVVAKEDNPPAAPQIRPIERLWALLKSRVYAGGYEAETKKQLTKRIRRQMAGITADTCQKLWRRTWTKIRFAADKGNTGLREL